jgi:hypothetical protein
MVGRRGSGVHHTVTFAACQDLLGSSRSFPQAPQGKAPYSGLQKKARQFAKCAIPMRNATEKTGYARIIDRCLERVVGEVSHVPAFKLLQASISKPGDATMVYNFPKQRVLSLVTCESIM